MCKIIFKKLLIEALDVFDGHVVATYLEKIKKYVMQKQKFSVWKLSTREKVFPLVSKIFQVLTEFISLIRVV